MKTKMPRTWVLITLAIIANIMIFVFFSRNLEGLMSSYYTVSAEAQNGKN